MKRPVPVLFLVAAVIAGVAVLVAAALQDTVVYYRTPTEVAQSSSDGGALRLGGQVMEGSLTRHAETTAFRLTDGRAHVLVVTAGALPGTFREGEGAVVEGRLGADGVFHADTVAVKHSNEYRPPAPGQAMGAPR